jgi:hypothetical protein
VQAFFGFAEYGFAFEKPITAVEGNQNCAEALIHCVLGYAAVMPRVMFI